MSEAGPAAAAVVPVAAPGDGHGLTVGVDVGGTKVLGVLLGPGLEVRRSVRLPSRHGPDGVVGVAVQTVRTLCREEGVAVTDLAGVGLGVPGLVDPVTGAVSHAVNLGLHDDVLLGPQVAAGLGVRTVEVENDLNIAALGAARVLGLDDGDLAFLALGTGLAAGLVLDGRLRRGFTGAAGEIGHLPYVPDGPACPCGQRGCLELYASGSALAAAWPGGDVFGAAADGDPRAQGVVADFADAVAAGVRHLVLGCDVEHVVLGGGVADVGPPLLAAVGAALARQALDSAFLRRLRMSDRLLLAPRGALVAPIGAALAVARATDSKETGSWRS